MRLLFLSTISLSYLTLTLIFCLSFFWLFNKKAKKSVLFLIQTLAIAYLIIVMLRIYHGNIAIFASLLALLWFWFLSLSIALPIYFLSRKKKISKLALPIIFFSLIAYSWQQAHNPITLNYHIEIENLPKMRIALVSDTHFGKQINKTMAEKLRDMLNAENPDIILMPGDIINDNASPFYKNNLPQILKGIQAPVYATLGNHEFYGDLSQNDQAIRDAGFILLRDEHIEKEHYTIIGRDDNEHRTRPSLDTLLEKAPNNKPIIVLDHRPDNITHASTLPIALQVSGHTHKGQIFPANFLVQKIYQLAHGYKELNGTHFFTSSGFGFWGAPFRLGSRSEIIIIDIN